MEGKGDLLPLAPQRPSPLSVMHAQSQVPPQTGSVAQSTMKPPGFPPQTGSATQLPSKPPGFPPQTGSATQPPNRPPEFPSHTGSVKQPPIKLEFPSQDPFLQSQKAQPANDVQLNTLKLAAEPGLLKELNRVYSEVNTQQHELQILKHQRLCFQQQIIHLEAFVAQSQAENAQLNKDLDLAHARVRESGLHLDYMTKLVEQARELRRAMERGQGTIVTSNMDEINRKLTSNMDEINRKLTSNMDEINQKLDRLCLSSGI